MARNQNSSAVKKAQQQQNVHVLNNQNNAQVQDAVERAAKLAAENACRQVMAELQNAAPRKQQKNNAQFNPFAQQQEENEHRPYFAQYNQEEQVNENVAARRNRAQYVGNVITALYEIIAARKNANPELSYTAHLHKEGSAALARKMMADAANATFTLLNSEESKYAVDDASNVVYDLLVMLEAKGYDVADLCNMLEQKIEESEADVGALVDGTFEDNPKYYQEQIESSRKAKAPRAAAKAKAPRAAAKAPRAAAKAKAPRAAAKAPRAAAKAKAPRAAAKAKAPRAAAKAPRAAAKAPRARAAAKAANRKVIKSQQN